MSGADSSRGPEPVWRGLGMGGAVLALLAMAWVHLAAGGAVDPMTGLISDYALLDDTAWALVGGTLALAAGCLWTAYGLARTDPAGSAAARVLLVASALGLLLTASFPTDAAPGVVSITGEIHRWSAAVVFTALPCAGRLLGRRSGDAVLSAVSVLSVLLLAAFLAAHPGSLTADLIDGPAYYGLVERLLMLSEIVLVLLAARGVGVQHGQGVVGRLLQRPAGAGELGPGVAAAAQPGADGLQHQREPLGLGSV
ncbi:DUF998 domain-containing protein [Planomonospora sp. ID67723]|uniref:DUF998 domain-containing protein n=1 Tax=Planomonospora sp. ID67723 TaxID=2738134 RepID=UPI0018C44B20|nr:DUF998 domain-containing protein [Planomonospora sp. ID67723]MBG0828621.1 DUF998 domain-containing protein [Planomonospora sp. ID67723]